MRSAVQTETTKKRTNQLLAKNVAAKNNKAAQSQSHTQCRQQKQTADDGAGARGGDDDSAMDSSAHADTDVEEKDAVVDTGVRKVRQKTEQKQCAFNCAVYTFASSRVRRRNDERERELLFSVGGGSAGATRRSKERLRRVERGFSRLPPLLLLVAHG